VSETEHNPTDRAAALRETLISVLLLDEADRPSRLRSCLERVAPEDVAAVLGDFDDDEKLEIFRALPSDEAKGVVLEETDQHSRPEVLEGLSEEERREVFEEMPVDDLVDHLEELPEAEQERIIAALDSEDAEGVRELQRYEPDTAGGMMTTEFVAVPFAATSGAALAKIQGNLDLEVIAYVYVVRAATGKLEGIVSIRELLRAQPETPVAELMVTDIVHVNVDTDQEEVAAVADKYNLSVIPVTADQTCIRGIVTFDDVIDALQEEHSEDMYRMAGTTATHPYYEPLFRGVSKRLPFLLMTMVFGLLVLLVQSHFRGHMNVWLFAIVAPMLHLINMVSGNVSIVTSTIFVRGYATGEISAARVWKAAARELAVGLSLALILSLLLGLALSFFFYAPEIEPDATAGLRFDTQTILVCAGGLFVSVLWAAMVGVLVPNVCRLTRVIDPAIASGPFVTSTVDISASVIFLAFVVFFLAS